MTQWASEHAIGMHLSDGLGASDKVQPVRLILMVSV